MKLTLANSKLLKWFIPGIIGLVVSYGLIPFFSRMLISLENVEQQIEADLSFSSDVTGVNVNFTAPYNKSKPVKSIPILTKWEIKISSKGEKHPDSRSSEIWVFGAKTPENELNPDNVVTSGSRKWSIEPDNRAVGKTLYAAAFIGPKEFNATVLGSHLKLYLLKHSWSGKANISVNGTSEEIDLFAPNDGVIITKDYSRSSIKENVTLQGKISFTHPPGKSDDGELVFEPSGEGSINVTSAFSSGKPLLYLGKNTYKMPTMSSRTTYYAVGLSIALWFLIMLLWYYTYNIFLLKKKKKMNNMN